MKSRSDTVNGLDIGSAYICWARGMQRDRLIANVGIQPLSTAHPDWLSNVKDGLAELVAAVKPGREDAVVSLPAEFALLKKIRMDAAEPDHDAVIEWELSQQVAGSIDEYSWDKESTGEEGSYSNYLVAGYRTKMVERLQSICKSSKVSIAAVDIDLFALVNVFEMNYAERLDEPAALVLIDLQRTKIALVRKGTLVDTEFFEHSPDMSAVNTYAAALSRAVGRLTEFNALAAAPPVFLAGCGLMQEGLAVSLIDALPGSDVLYPFRTVTCNVAMTDEELRTYSPQLAVAVGLALTPDR